MSVSTLDHEAIELFWDISDLTPVSRTCYEDW